MSKDQKTSMTDEQQEKAIEWLEKHGGKKSRACEICLEIGWVILGDIVTPMIYANHGLTGTVYPQFMLMCKICGNTKYFNAIAAGLIQKDEETKDAK